MGLDHDETENKSFADVVRGDDVGEIVNGGTINGHRKKDYVEVEDEDDSNSKSLYTLLCLTVASILFPDSKTGDESSSLLQRIRNSFIENGPKLREASARTSREVLIWARGGSPFRALLVITLGTIVLLTTMAMVVFTLFFIAATANAIIISLLISLAVAGGFLALFFFSLTAIYIGALSVAAFVISTCTISAVVSVLIASGWIGFFYAVWLGTKGSLHLAKQSVSMVGLAISGNTFSRHQPQDGEVKIESSN